MKYFYKFCNQLNMSTYDYLNSEFITGIGDFPIFLVLFAKINVN